jgi:hypothetical protein
VVSSFEFKGKETCLPVVHRRGTLLYPKAWNASTDRLSTAAGNSKGLFFWGIELKEAIKVTGFECTIDACITWSEHAPIFAGFITEVYARRLEAKRLG